MKFFVLFLLSQLAYAQLPPVKATFVGESPGDCLSCVSSVAGDINGDGVHDVIMGAGGYDADGIENSGRMYVFFGRNFSGNIPVQSADLIIDGETEFGGFTSWGILCCDVDGDSLYDILSAATEVDCTYIDDMGNPSYLTLNRLYIFLGKTIRNQTHLYTSQADGYIEGYFDSANWKKSIYLIGEHPTSGDFNNDGYDDVLFLTRYYSPLGSNFGFSAYLFYGSMTFGASNISVTNRSAILYATSLSTSDRLPIKMGDINGDGYEDIAISGGIRYNMEPIQAVCVIYGGEPLVDSVRVDDADVIIEMEPDSYTWFDGTGPLSIVAEDINSDSVGDLIIGRSHYDQQTTTSREGMVYVFYGRDPWPVYLSSNEADVTIEGTVPGYFTGRFGESIAAGDLNHDGQNDLAIWSAGCAEYGKIHLFKGFGYRDTTLYDFDSDAIYSDCSSLDTRVSTSILSVDITGDDQPELVAGASSNSYGVGVVLLFNNLISTLPGPGTQLPQRLILYQNYPNPFNPSTTIAYSLPKHGQVRLRIYNALGQLVRTLVDRVEPPGERRVIWDGKNNGGKEIATGIYIYQLESAGASLSRKMLLIR